LRRRFSQSLLVTLLALTACGTQQQARSPCPPRISASDETVATCTYRNGATIARVRVDHAPQAQFRFSRAVVEGGQAHLGDPPAELPQVLEGIGAGAAWTAARRELLATDGRRLVTVTVQRPRSGEAARTTAVAIARAALR
jgi:hypothetical protein